MRLFSSENEFRLVILNKEQDLHKDWDSLKPYNFKYLNTNWF